MNDEQPTPPAPLPPHVLARGQAGSKFDKVDAAVWVANSLLLLIAGVVMGYFAPFVLLISCGFGCSLSGNLVANYIVPSMVGVPLLVGLFFAKRVIDLYRQVHYPRVLLSAAIVLVVCNVTGSAGCLFYMSAVSGLPRSTQVGVLVTALCLLFGWSLWTLFQRQHKAR